MVNSILQHIKGPNSHLLVCLEDVLSGNRADSCAQRLDDSVRHFCAYTGGVGVQDTEVALITLHHQLQRAPLREHAAEVYCTLLTPPASTCKHKYISYDSTCLKLKGQKKVEVALVSTLQC